MSFGFFACERIEKPGNIPGMGDTPGTLQAEKYEFNEGLSFSSFTGISNNSTSSILKSTATDEIIYEFEEFTQGSGDQVVLKVTITNNSDECRTAWFRAGTVFQVNKDGYQNAILLAPVAVCVDAGQSKTVILNLYCLNLGKEGSDETASYEFLGVTTSETMLQLLDRLRYRMINYEHLVAYYDLDLYIQIKDKLQEIVWAITNGTGTVDDYMDFINTIPKVDGLGLYPDGIYNENPSLPDCDWCLPCSGTGALSYVAFLTGCDGTPAPSSGSYITNGFNFNVETNWNLKIGKGESKKLKGAIKFEATGDQLGEDGAVDEGIFVFNTSCEVEDLEVITKNKDEEHSIIEDVQVGAIFNMANGFTVEFVSVEGDDSGYIYTFKVMSDNCSGSQEN